MSNTTSSTWTYATIHSKACLPLESGATAELRTSPAKKQQPSPGWGNLGRLPYDVRSLIWQLIDPVEQNVNNIRQASKSLCADVDSVFKTLDLRITVSGEEHKSEKCPTGIDIGDQYKEWPTIYPKFLSFSSPEKQRFRQICNLRLDQFKSLTLEIKRPNPNIRGELIRCWNCIVFLTRLFKRIQSRDFKMKIIFQKNTMYSWYRSDSYIFKQIDQNNFFLRSVFGEEYMATELEILMIPFRTLRETQFSIKAPFELHFIHGGRINESIAEIISLSKLPSAVDSIRSGEFVDKLNTMFDIELDSLPDSCSAILRLERFAFWSRRRTAGYEIMTKAHYLDIGVSKLSVKEFYASRRKGLLAYNPESHVVKYDENSWFCRPFEYVLPTIDQRINIVNQNGCEDEVKGRVSSWFERYRTQGIPHKTSKSYRRQLRKLCPIEVICTDCYRTFE